MKDNPSEVHHWDARNLLEKLGVNTVDVTITSPPYFDLKDYGYKEQIGFGQTYENYLNDLKIVFQNVHSATKDSGTLWVIIDSFRQNGEVTPLPFDFSNKLKEIGWKLQEVIIWEKDRTVPWAHKGQMRNLFEYILLFSKSTDYNFYIDRIRDRHSLKQWWVKYPERYNPKGKTPTGIWQFDIPTQGSWGSGYIRHFCPLPEMLIARILELTTNEGDLVLDPFSGSGAVLAKADSMKRKYVGFELNKKYIDMFSTYLDEQANNNLKEFERSQKYDMTDEDFYELILRLKILKFARVFYSKLDTDMRNSIVKIYVKHEKEGEKRSKTLIKAGYYILITAKNMVDGVNREISAITRKAPLSKFGIDYSFNFFTNIDDFRKSWEQKELYAYTSKITHTYTASCSADDWFMLPVANVIISNEMVELNEKDFI